jgi:TolA-binding protein
VKQARSNRNFEAQKHVGVWVGVVFLLVCATGARGQRPAPAAPTGGPGTTTLGNATDTNNLSTMALLPVTITVNVREASGMLLEGHAFVKLSSGARHYSQTQATQDNSSAAFHDVIRGDYEVEVSAAGYRTASEHVSVAGGGSSIPLFIYLHSESEEAVSAKPGPSVSMTPKLQGELDKGMEKMRKQQYDGARQHFEKAVKIAPGNADVQYLLGMTELSQKHFEAARAKFEGALAMSPTHERSLLALGELQLQTGDADGAVRTLEKAAAVNGADWRMHFLLAQAYNSGKDYKKAAPHAVRAAELGKDKAALPLLLLGRIYEAENQREVAKQAFEMVIKEFPEDPAAQQAKTEIAALGTLPAAEATTVAAALPALSLDGDRGNNLSNVRGNDKTRGGVSTTSAALGLPDRLPITITERAWAPADVDAKEYNLAQGVSCGQADVLERAQKRMLHQLQNFERFMATEQIEHQEVDAHGREGNLRSKDFSYLVFVHSFKKDSYFLEESRDGGMGVDAFPTSLATTGLVGLGVALLEREYENDFEYKCEGLSSWRGQAAWQVRFEQKRDMESRVRVWRRRGEVFPVALKGRIWLAANSYDLLHMESDLRDPVEKLALVRDHLMIDYGPVSFETGSEKLWLPWRAEMFMELHGKRYHHRHTLTNYMLFSVDTKNQIGKPKQAPEPPETEERPLN